MGKIKLEFHTEQRIINDLIPFEHNPRRLTEMQKEKLQASLEKFGLAEIPVINTDNVLCAGHQRVALLKVLGKGDEDIDVRVPNRLMTEAEVKEYNIRSNKNTGEWDDDILANVFDQEDLIDWGFEKHEVFFHDDIDGETMAERKNVITVEAPESIRLKERHSFYFKKKNEYDLIVKVFGKGGERNELDVDKLLKLL